MSKTNRLDDDVVDSLRLAARVVRLIVLDGDREFDRLMVRNGLGGSRVCTLERLAHDSVDAEATWVYDPGTQAMRLVRAADQLQRTDMPGANETRSMTAVECLRTFSAGPANEGRRQILIFDASLLFMDPVAPQGEEFRLLQALERHARMGNAARLVLLRTSRSAALPTVLLRSPYLRAIHLPSATRDVRYAYSLGRANDLAKQVGSRSEDMAHSLSAVSEGWTLEQLDALIATAQEQHATSLPDVEDVAHSLRTGASPISSPWFGERIRAAVADAPRFLSERVIGQPAAISAVVNALGSAVTGLADAHKGEASRAPRACFLIAGPTGSGKTELIKALAALLFHSEDRLIRIDMSEYADAASHSRLIGAPPGYVGHDRPGQLTDAVMRNPHSVVLLDEVEKAHPDIYRLLLGVLDDGRLTDSHGNTVDFSQCLLVMTSNLGVTEEVVNEQGQLSRRLCLRYGTPYEMLQAKVKTAIKDEFTRIGLPEFLGRIGDDGIVVFDWLRDLERVAEKFTRNVAARAKRLHGIELSVGPVLIKHMVEVTKDSSMGPEFGARALRPALTRLLIQPLSRYLCERPAAASQIRASWRDGQTVFEEL